MTKDMVSTLPYLFSLISDPGKDNLMDHPLGMVKLVLSIPLFGCIGYPAPFLQGGMSEKLRWVTLSEQLQFTNLSNLFSETLHLLIRGLLHGTLCQEAGSERMPGAGPTTIHCITDRTSEIIGFKSMNRIQEMVSSWLCITCNLQGIWRPQLT